MHVPARVVSVRKFSHRLIDLIDRLKNYEQTSALGWIKEASVTLVDTSLMDDYCNQGKDD